LIVFLFHPALVHFSVAFLITGGACEACGIFLDRAALERFGGRLVMAGAVSLVPTIIAGFVARNGMVDSSETLTSAIDLHERAGLVLLGFFGVAVLWRAWGQGQIPNGHRKIYAVWLILGIAVAVYTAWLGGGLVYGLGAGVNLAGIAP
jgi:uncharacterized membrane protein